MFIEQTIHVIIIIVIIIIIIMIIIIIIIILIIVIVIVIVMGFSLVVGSSSWVSHVKSLLLSAAQRCNTFLRIYVLLPTRPTSGRFQQYQGYSSLPAILQNLSKLFREPL